MGASPPQPESPVGAVKPQHRLDLPVSTAHQGRSLGARASPGRLSASLPFAPSPLSMNTLQGSREQQQLLQSRGLPSHLGHIVFISFILLLLFFFSGSTDLSFPTLISRHFPLNTIILPLCNLFPQLLTAPPCSLPAGLINELSIPNPRSLPQLFNKIQPDSCGEQLGWQGRVPARAFIQPPKKQSQVWS